MKKPEKSPTLTERDASGSRALITIPRPKARRGVLAAAVRLVAAILLLPVRLPVVALVAMARGAARVGSGAGRGLAAVGRGLLRVPVLIGRLVLAPFVLLARGIAWVAPRAGRGGVALLLLPVRIVVGIARLVALLARALALTVLFILRIPFIALRLLGRGAVGVARGLGMSVRGLVFLACAVTVPAFALAWGGVRYMVAGVIAVLRGIAIALAFLGRLAGLGVFAILRGVLATFGSLAIGIFVCVRGLLRAALWVVLTALLGVRFLAVALVRGIRALSILLADAARTVALGLAELAGGAIALGALALRSGPARSFRTSVATREPQRACFLPLATLAVLGGMELISMDGFPFATLCLMLLGAFAALALLPRPTTMVAALLAWVLAVAAGWRAERVSASSPVWIDSFVYLSALAALRSAYVAARAFVREVPVAGRDADQERAHRRASRAIGLVLAVQCIGFTLWSAIGGVSDTHLLGELLLVGAGMALAWVVRSGQYVLTAQIALTVAAIATLIGTIATQLTAFAMGHLYTATSLGVAFLLVLVAAALIIVVHTRLVDVERGA